MDQILFNEPQLGKALAKRAGTHYNPECCSNICRVRNDVPLGGVVFTDFTGESITIHSGAWHPHWINRDMLWVTFDYPFNQLGVKRIFGQVPEDNEHARRFNEKLGFRIIHRIEGVYKGGLACLLMCLERYECRMLDLKPRMLARNLH